MARIRTIKPEFWQDEKLAPLSPVDRLVFLGLISMADDCGRLLDNVKVIDAFIFPETSETCRGSIGELSRRGRLERGFTESGQRVIQIVNWERHQRIEKPNTRAALPQIVTYQRDADFPGNVGETSGMGRGGVGDESPLRPTTNDLRPTTVVAGAETENGGGNVKGWSEFLEAVPEGYLHAVHGAIRAATNPDALRRELVNIPAPITGGPAYPVSVVAQALHELAVAGSRVTSGSLKAFCRKIAQGEPAAKPAGGDADVWSPEAIAKIGEAA